MRAEPAGKLYEELLRLRREGRGGVLVTVVDKQGSGPAEPGAKLLMTDEPALYGTVGGGSLENQVIEEARRMLAAGSGGLRTFDMESPAPPIDARPTGMVCGGTATLFFEVLLAARRVFLFGAGHVGRALVGHLAAGPFHVTVVDARPGMAEALLALGADRAVAGDETRAPGDDDVPPGSFFVLASHSHDLDYRILLRVLQSGWRPAYIGLLASKRKAAQFLADARATLGPALDASLLSVLYTPAGLDLGGSSPDAIAVSIVAEAQGLLHGRTGLPHLRLPELAAAGGPAAPGA